MNSITLRLNYYLGRYFKEKHIFDLIFNEYIAGVRVIDNSCYSLQRLFKVLKYSSYTMFM